MDDLIKLAVSFRHQLPTLALHLHIIYTALVPIYTGSYASLSRPSTAAKPAPSTDDDEEEDQEPEEKHEMESLTARDAIMFPIIAGTTLVILYYLIKKFGADLINLILAWYFAGAVIFSTGMLFSDSLQVIIGYIFPAYYKDCGALWKVNGRDRTAVTGITTDQKSRTSPLPGFIARLPLGQSINQRLWMARDLTKQKYVAEAYVKDFASVKAIFTGPHVAAIICSLATVAYSSFVSKPWWLTNIQGFAVSYFALQFISPTSFTIGSLVLCGLFFYDIWAVFFTPFMVFAATNLDQPVKMVFPRPDVPEDDGGRQYSMLGLGDIVLPGLVVGLSLRFDLYMYYLRKQYKTVDGKIEKAAYTAVKGHSGSLFWTMGLQKASLPLILQNAKFPTPYFTSAMMGYIEGMIITLLVMNYSEHAQPALLYLVPSVLLSVWGTAWYRGELKEMINYSEALTGEAIEDEESKDASKKDHEPKQAQDNESWAAFLIGLLGFKTAKRDDAAGSDEVSKKQLDKDKVETEEQASTKLKDDAQDNHFNTFKRNNPDTVLHFSVKNHVSKKISDSKKTS